MKAIFQTRYGKSHVLQYGDQSGPTSNVNIKPHQLLIANHASSVNPRDWMIRSGHYQLQFLVPSFPLILGSDFAGVVLAVGSGVKNHKVGDRVFGMKNPSQGLATYAEHVVVNEQSVVSIPANLSFIDAAGIPLCALTAWQALMEKAKLKAGMKVLIIGASGGVGSYAVQIASAMGAQVSAVCSADNQKMVKELGAQRVIDYKKQDFINEPSIDNNYHVIFDTIGRHSLKKCASHLHLGGCYVSTIPSPNNLKSIFSEFFKSIVLPFMAFKHTKIVMVKSSAADLEKISNLVLKDKIKPLIDSVYPLKDAAQAHDHSRSLRAKGKIILQIR